MSKDYNHEIGYETLQSEWKLQCKRTPRGVTLVKSGKKILLQFKTPNTTRSKYDCACNFSIDGMHEAVRKAGLVKAKLTSLTSEVEFWEWYNKEIKEESQLVDDRITFEEAIKRVEDDFWNRPSRTKRERDKNNPSDYSSWTETYGRFLKALPASNTVNISDIIKSLNNWKKGRRSYKYAVSAYKKLCRVIKRQDLLELLNEIDTTQTKNINLQSITLDDFLTWRDKLIGESHSLHKNSHLEIRKPWIWVFSMQVAYGLRISEVFAIKNLTEPYITKDGVLIPALNNQSDTNNLIYIGDKTVLGTTVKTGSRIARPQVPPKYPDLLEKLEVKNPMLPTNKPKSKNHDTVRKFYVTKSRRLLTKWNAPFTQTHALRHLANINGIQAGIPQEVRAQSMGHTVQMNESVYKKRQSTQTTIDLLLNSNTQAIDFVTALSEAKRLLKNDSLDKDTVVALLSVIYQKDSKSISSLLTD